MKGISRCLRPILVRGRHADRLRSRRGSAAVVVVAMLVALLGVVAAPARPAAAAPDGQLTVRAIASACGFRNLTTQLDVCLDLPGVWFPSEVANFWAIQNGGPNTPDCDITQVTEAAANIGPTPTSTGVFECNGRDHDTANLLASIFTGTANGHPDIPASLPAEWGGSGSRTRARCHGRC